MWSEKPGSGKILSQLRNGFESGFRVFIREIEQQWIAGFRNDDLTDSTDAADQSAE
jgi:hypothetical protein